MYILFSAYGTFTKIDHMVEHKASFSKYQMTEILQSLFSDRCRIKVEFNNRKLVNPQTFGNWITFSV